MNIADFQLGGDFRLDSLAETSGVWAFVVKCVVGRSSGYATITTGHDGKGLVLWMRGSTMLDDSPVIDADFELLEDATSRDAGFALCRSLLSVGFTGCCDQQNIVVARQPDDLRRDQFSESGTIGSAKP